MKKIVFLVVVLSSAFFDLSPLSFASEKGRLITRSGDAPSRPHTCIDRLNNKIAAMDPIQADISFLIADLKFDGEQIKICEFGEGPRSRFKGHDALFGKGLIWDRFWSILSEYDMPKWYIENGLPHNKDNAIYKEMNAEICASKWLTNKSGVFGGLKQFTTSPVFKAIRNNPHQVYANEFNAAGLVILRHNDASSHELLSLHHNNPQILVLNTATAPFVNDKFTTDVLFKNDEELEPFRPKALLCRKRYTSHLAVSIKKQIPCDVYVIKPLDAFKGCGVIMVAADDLDATLRNILTNPNALPGEFTIERNGYSYTDKTYSYWQTYREPYFIVEELCHSKPLVFEGKPYDPTMRVVFALRYAQEEIKIDYLAAYWKLPLKALNEHGAMTEKFKSVGIVALPLSDEETELVYKKFDEFMPKLYTKMISIINNKTKLTVPFQAE